MKNLIIWAVLLGGIAYGGAKLYLHHKVESGLDSAVIMMSPYAEVTYEGVSSTMSGKLTVNGLRAHIKGFNDEIHVDHFGIDTPSFLTLLELGDIAAGKYGFSPAALVDLGYDEQLVSFAMYLQKSGPSELIKMTATVDEMWEADIDLTLAASTKNAMASRDLSELKFVLTDRSLKKRVSDYCEQLGLSPEETLQAQLDALHFFGESNGIVFDEYVLGPYKEYLAGKTTLVVTAEPSNPVNLTQIGLYKPSDVPALLNLSATAQ